MICVVSSFLTRADVTAEEDQGGGKFRDSKADLMKHSLIGNQCSSNLESGPLSHQTRYNANASSCL